MSQPADTVVTTLAARVEALVEEVLSGTPHYLVEVLVRGTKGARVVEVFVDSDGDLGVDALAQISRDLAFLIDTEEVLDGRYRLDVSSPGVDRPLRLPRQYAKNVGRRLRVAYRMGERTTETEGELTVADDDGITIQPKKGDARRIGYDDIAWAKVQLPW